MSRRWVLLVGVIAALGNVGMVERLAPKLTPAALPIDAVTTLRVSAVTDSALVLTWTEISTHGSGAAKYVVRTSSVAHGVFVWTAQFDVMTGGCAAPVYGSTGGGGRTRSCVLTGLAPATGYYVQIVAYTGTLNVNATFGPLSNLVQATTAERVGPMLVSRPRMLLDTVVIAAVEVSDFASTRFPLRGTFRLGDRLAVFYDSTGAVAARGYLLVVKP